MRILVAGVGNALKGDDAFGVEAVAALERDHRLPAGVVVIETGIGGIHLVQELMRGYDALILFDACDRGADPGEVFLLQPDLPGTDDFSDRERRDFFADMHYATPVRALTLAREIGALPARVRIVGCQVAGTDGFGEGMHPSVAAAIPAAVDLALEVISLLDAG